MVVSEITLFNTLKANDVLATKSDIAKLDVRISETKSEIIKWMFIFWIGSVGVLSGIMFAMLNAYLRH